ncbi:AEC family transporter [Consotaella salsifontis]|uniref:Permease n=1 Tax=Consotaella salsifontis TaxID=1365950 RepID=A0A1T4RSF4_9HYPH|nr:AEC family transporter [Consotaella salsifontis]SKA18786.1 hypothetical protein SAMN05428963_107223 [Consotaella salsifontis]
MQTIFNVIVPIFGLIAIGYAVARLKILSHEKGDALTSFVFMIGVPSLLFHTLAGSEMKAANPLLLWAVYFGCVAINWTIASILVRKIAGADRRKSVIAGVAASAKNGVFVGIPAVELAYGQPGLQVLLLIIAVHLPVIMMTSTILTEWAAVVDAREPGRNPVPMSSGGALRRVAKNLGTNPLVIGLALGAVWFTFGLPLGPLDEITASLGRTASPLALFALGMSLDRYSVRGDIASTLIASTLSIVLLPVLVYFVGSQVLSPLWLKVAVLMAACPAGINCYVLAGYFGSGQRMAAATILITTLASVFGLSFWLTALG